MIYSLDWLLNKFDRAETIKYIFFWGDKNRNDEPIGKFVFSQWHYAPFIINDIIFKTTEHWMMYQKAKLFDDHATSEKIISADKPGEVKELGRQIKDFDEAIWTVNRYAIVKQGNIYKFGQNKILGEYLRSTGERVLVEASPTDTIWGVGLTHDSGAIENPHTWRGLNLLGFALMEVRDFLNGPKDT